MIKEEICKLLSDNVEACKDFSYGDYYSSLPLKIAKETGLDPMVVAEEIIDRIKKPDSISKIEVAKPGFINFFLSEGCLKQELKDVFDKLDKYGSGDWGKGKTIVIDYSSPNIAKSFGIGHLRSTIIGQAIYNIYKFSGWNCIGDNHIGDWGTQFGKLIFQIKKCNLVNDIENLTVQDLESLYVDFHKDVVGNPEIEDEAREYFKRLESGDEEIKKIWQVCVKKSLEEFERIYNILGVKIDNIYGESFYTSMASDIIKEAEDLKISRKSEGATIIEFDDLPVVILAKSDGSTTYFARDLATIKYRVNKWNPDKIVYEVGSDQSLYFKQLFKAAKMFNWSSGLELVHINHGLVRWPHGKFSTRKGDTIHLESVLKESIKRAGDIVDQPQDIAQMVGIGAVKYNDLSQHYSRDIVFDWDKMINLKGNSGPYIQYTFARANSVLEKYIGQYDHNIEISNEEELLLLRKIRFWTETVELSAKNYSPNIICNFLFDLSQTYNLFYNNNRIIGGKNEKTGIALTFAVATVIKNGLTLLGIDFPNKM
ncbi:MAG: Arginine--tRNA ligase [Parcubacteria group bacterium ADurb.Bin247]|nr:MAG: Arginine--tRNA ligase [Parcubacteria group bacterium ADurb.Bin247]